MSTKRVLKKKPEVKALPQLQESPVKAKRVLKSKKSENKPIIKLKNSLLPVPPPPAPGIYVTKVMEAFEAMREYYESRDWPIPQADIKWYNEELEREKKEDEEFWAYCAVTKATMDGVLRGDDDWTIQLAENEARQKVKALPIKQEDIGPMPEYGTKDFWAWCNKRKKFKEQREAEKKLQKSMK
jgi:hypothetical protein